MRPNDTLLIAQPICRQLNLLFVVVVRVTVFFCQIMKNKNLTCEVVTQFMFAASYNGDLFFTH